MAETWTFLTNHARVLLLLHASPDARGRDIADQVGITERATQRIVADLEAAGYLSHERVGRRNHYEVHAAQPLRHPMQDGHEVAALLAIFEAVEAASPD